MMRYGHVLNFFNFDEATFQDFLTKKTFPAVDIFAILRNGIEYHHQTYTMALDAMFEVPTEFGLSVILDLQIPTQVSVNLNQLKVKVEPSVFAHDRSFRAPTNIQVHADGRFSTDTVHLVTMSILSPFEKIKYGAGYEFRKLITIPLKGSVTYDFATAKLETEYEPMHEEIFHTHFEPVTFIDSYVNQVELQEERSYTPIGIHKFRHQVRNILESLAFEQQIIPLLPYCRDSLFFNGTWHSDVGRSAIKCYIPL